MAAPPTNSSAVDSNAAANAPLAAAVSAATAASNVWPNTRDSYELREVIGTFLETSFSFLARRNASVYDNISIFYPFDVPPLTPGPGRRPATPTPSFLARTTTPVDINFKAPQ